MGDFPARNIGSTRRLDRISDGMRTESDSVGGHSPENWNMSAAPLPDQQAAAAPLRVAEPDFQGSTPSTEPSTSASCHRHRRPDDCLSKSGDGMSIIRATGGTSSSLDIKDSRHTPISQNGVGNVPAHQQRGSRPPSRLCNGFDTPIGRAPQQRSTAAEVATCDAAATADPGSPLAENDSVEGGDGTAGDACDSFSVAVQLGSIR